MFKILPFFVGILLLVALYNFRGDVKNSVLGAQVGENPINKLLALAKINTDIFRLSPNTFNLSIVTPTPQQAVEDMNTDKDDNAYYDKNDQPNNYITTPEPAEVNDDNGTTTPTPTEEPEYYYKVPDRNPNKSKVPPLTPIPSGFKEKASPTTLNLESEVNILEEVGKIKDLNSETLIVDRRENGKTFVKGEKEVKVFGVFPLKFDVLVEVSDQDNKIKKSKALGGHSSLSSIYK